ncbi:MAG: AraC family transcriptional regulator [Gemmiger sp.]|nr:AraC family transcriptional regulator [Gemmiger sp.]
MQNQSFQTLPRRYRPYHLPSDFPVVAFLGRHWLATMGQPLFLHFHNCIEIGYCISGKGTVCFENSVADYQEGDFSIIYPNTPHITTSPTSDSCWEYIFVDIDLLFAPKNGIQGGEGLSALFYAVQQVPLLLSANMAGPLYQLLRLLFQEFHHKESLYDQAIHGLLLTVLTDLAFLGFSDDEGHPPHCLTAVSHAIRHIRQHYAEAVTLKELAALSFLSESHFRRIFTQAVGLSPQAYLERYRISRARDLIYTKAIPFNEVAKQVGFTSVSSFNRQFQKHMHMSPSEWVRSNTEAPFVHELFSFADKNSGELFDF